MKFSLEEIIKATGAKVIKKSGVDDLKFTFSTDTRTIKKGEIYLPLRGENFDGEDFIDKAIEAGASGYFIREDGAENKEYNFLLTSKSTINLVLQVKDVLAAYLQLANFYRKKVNPKTIAITGSSGKTTTKEMAYCVANEKFKTHKSELNFNNEIGLCKTILSMPEDTEVLILEMGMRGLGEIELLSKYAQPDIAIITNIGSSHIGRLGSKENIAKAKCEIIKYLEDDGILIAHDDKLIKNEIENQKLMADSYNFSHLTIHDNYFSLKNANILERQIGYSKFEYKTHNYELNIEGDYNIQNSLAVIEMGLKLGMSEKDISTGLKKYLPITKRWEIDEINGYKIINDSYNANPESMKAAIETFLTLYTPPLLLVLGDMGELGEKEIGYHQKIGDFLVEKINKNLSIKVFTVGTLAKEITKRLIEKGFSSVNFNDNLQTSRYILDNVKIGTTIILKASRSMKFEEIINEIKSKEQRTNK